MWSVCSGNNGRNNICGRLYTWTESRGARRKRRKPLHAADCSSSSDSDGRVVFWCLVCHTLWWAAGEGLKVAVILERNSRLRCRVASIPSCRDPLGTGSVQEGPQHLPCDFPGGEGSGCTFQSNFTLAAAAEVLAFNPAVLGRSKIQGPVLSNHLQGTQSSLPNPGVGLACGFALQTP